MANIPASDTVIRKSARQIQKRQALAAESPVLSDASNSPRRRTLTAEQKKRKRQLQNKIQYERRKARIADDRAVEAAVEDRAKAIASGATLRLRDELEDLRSTLNDKEVQLIETEKENRSFQADKLRAENVLEKRTTRFIESSAKAKARSAKLSRDKVSANKAKREAEDTAKKERKVSAAAKTTNEKLKVCQHVSLSLSLSFVF